MSEPETLPHAAGCVVYRRDGAGAPLVLLIKDQYGFWTLPKGHLDPGESAAEAAVREVCEETGVAGELGPYLGEVTYPVTGRRGERYIKRVAFFLMLAHAEAVTPQAEEGISAARWYPPQEALARNGYRDMGAVLRRAVELIGREVRPSDRDPAQPHD